MPLATVGVSQMPCSLASITIEPCQHPRDETIALAKEKGALPLHGYLQYRIHAGEAEEGTVCCRNPSRKQKRFSKIQRASFTARNQAGAKNALFGSDSGVYPPR